MIKYLGSKRMLVPLIVEVIRALPGVHSVLDLFAGTSRVGHALKREGFQVFANDHNAYAATLARCYIEADDDLALPAQALLDELSALEGRPGFFTETYCHRSRFVQPHNGARIDAMRDAIAAMALSPTLEAVLLTALLEAVDRVDSTTGLQMAYLKQWAPRAYRNLSLRLPDLLPRPPTGACRASQLDALEAAQQTPADVVYLDPPYNQHRYRANYHIWETLVRWDRPEVYGVACKRIDCLTHHSPFNSRPRAADAFAAVIAASQAPYLVVSFSNEGYISRPQMESLLASRGHVTVISRRFPRYMGARIGIYSPLGEKVGQVSHLHNTEHLYIVSPEPLPLPPATLAPIEPDEE